jgi:hypothetical protein
LHLALHFPSHFDVPIFTRYTAVESAHNQRRVCSDQPCGGGCDARALTACGVWPSEGIAKAELNKPIDRVWASFKAQDPSCPRERAGVDGVEWAFDVVAQAVRAAGWHLIPVHKLMGVNQLEDVDLPSMLKGEGAFLVDGFLNDAYHRKRVPGGKPFRVAVSGKGDGRWRHSTAVVGGKVRDHGAFITTGEMPVTFLFPAGKKGKYKGFMREIVRVYRVAPCATPAAISQQLKHHPEPCVEKGPCELCMPVERT